MTGTANTDAERKTCPDCAEAVQAAAKVCRFCGYRFDREVSGAEVAASARRRPSGPKSAAGAAVLSFVIPGLGHFYLGEGWRGGVFLASFLVAVLGAIYTETIGPAWIIGIIGAVDAYRGAKLADGGPDAPVREVTTPVWTMLGAVIALVIAGVAAYESRSPDIDGGTSGDQREREDVTVEAEEFQETRSGVLSFGQACSAIGGSSTADGRCMR